MLLLNIYTNNSINIKGIHVHKTLLPYKSKNLVLIIAKKDLIFFITTSIFFLLILFLLITSPIHKHYTIIFLFFNCFRIIAIFIIYSYLRLHVIYKNIKFNTFSFIFKRICFHLYTFSNQIIFIKYWCYPI